MADHHAPGAAGKTPVRNQTHGFAHALTDQRTGGCQHFLHAGAAFGAFVADHQHIAVFDLLRHDRIHGLALGVEHTRRAGDFGRFQSGDLGHTAFGRQVAFQNREMPLFVHRIVPLPDHILIGARISWYFGQRLFHGLTGDGHAVTVQQAVVQQHFQHLRHTACTVKIHRHVAPRRFQVAQHRYFLAHALKIVDGPFDVRGMRHRQIVQYGVGGTAGGHDQRHGVFYRFAGDDVERLDVHFDGVDQHARGFCRGVCLLGIGGSHLRRAQHAHAQRLERARHGVGGVHAAAGAYRRAGIFFDADEIFFAHFAGCISAHRFKRTDDGEINAFPLAGLDGARVHINRRHVDAQHGNHAAGHVFVAAAAYQHAVHRLTVDRGFDAVGDHFA